MSERIFGINTEYTERPICTASRQYQYQKLKELDAQNLPETEYQKQFDKITAPECLCVGLSEPSIITHQIDYKIKDNGVTVCPGPNMAYFHQVTSLKDMIGHIYGRTDLIGKRYRPNMFVKELNLYIDYLKNQLDEIQSHFDKKQSKYFEKFAANLESGIQYYQELFTGVKGKLADKKDEILSDLEKGKQSLKSIIKKIATFEVQ